MSRRFAGSEGRRRPLFAIGIAVNTALISLLMSSFGATPALAYNTQPVINQEGSPDVTDNVWLKLYCLVTLTDNPLTTAPAHIGVILRSTHPESVDPGQVFDTTNNTAVQVLPDAAQKVALATYHPDRFAGIVTDFELHGTNAVSNFSPGSSGAPNKVQVNQVQAVNPNNNDAPSPVDPLIDPLTPSAPAITGSITAGSKTLTVSSAGGLVAGQPMTLEGAGPSGNPFNTTIASISGTTVTTTTAASTTVAGQAFSLAAPGDERTFTDGATNSTTTITSPAQAQFVQGQDEGANIYGAGIPAGDTISSVTNATTAVLAVAATATASGVTMTIRDDWWDQLHTPGTASARHAGLSFGAIPTPGGQNPATAANAYGPSPGVGGGPSPTDGTPDPLHIFPLTTTGAAGTNISIVPGQPADPGNGLAGRTIPVGAATEIFAAHADIFFHQTQPTVKWVGSAQTPGIGLGVDCGLDDQAEGATGAVSVPYPGYCTTRPSLALPQGLPIGTLGEKCYTSDDSTSPSPAPAAARPGIQIPIVSPNVRAESAISTAQYTLTSSDGTTWQDIDTSKWVQEAPTVSQSTLLTANADLWTWQSGQNQDIGIFVSHNGGADSLVAWKEAGGSAGTFSPNAAFVQSVYAMTGGDTYVFKLKWKTAQAVPAGNKISAAAGPISGAFSPTSLTSATFPAASPPNIAVSTQQYTLTSSDGTTWQDIDATNLKTDLVAGITGTAVLGGNADLWTWQSGQNQDIGIFAADGAGADTLVSWKESGGSAGTFSPNAAFVKGTLNVVSGHTYHIKLKWKTAQAVPAGNKISAGAGPISGAFSPTSVFAYIPNPTTNLQSAVSSSQYSLTSSDGVTWTPIDAALDVNVGPLAADKYALLGANADLWTWQSGQNQDIGIFVADGGGPDTLVAWKESGGSAGTFSPNAAFVQTRYAMASGHTYHVKLKWKTAQAVPAGNKISAGAGPISGAFSPTRVTVELAN